MAVVSCRISVSPSDVFVVLSNGWLYSGWVVGTSHMRAVEAAWPLAGSRLFHASGVWPAVVRDETLVEVCERDQRLVMVARGGSLGAARIVVELAADGAGTTVTMTETPIEGWGRRLHNPVNEELLRRRNVESLVRLRLLAERPVTAAPTQRQPDARNDSRV